MTATSPGAWDWDEGSLARLTAFLGVRGLTSGPLTTRRIGDGHSNLTYLVTDGARRVVVRRPPPPPTPPGAHDMRREWQVLTALAATPVPVPQVLATAETGELLDVPCYVMTHVEGPVVTTATPPPLDGPATRRQVGEHLVDVLAALHAVDWQLVGGRPDGFNRRHVATLARLVPDGSPDVVEVHDWLVEHAPAESAAALLHNDFRIGNVVLAPDAPGRVAAVLDWELATVGDPLADLGYLVASVPDGEAVTATEQMGVALLEEGYPTRAEVVERYASATGRDVSGLAWYVTLAQWKLAALYAYQRRRATDAYYADDDHVAAFAAAAQRTSRDGW